MHDTRRKYSDNTFPIKLRVIYDRKSKYYTLKLPDGKYGLTVEEWEKVHTAKKGKYRTIGFEILQKENEAIEIINSLSEFSFTKFETLFIEKKDRQDLLVLLIERYEKLYEGNQFRTADLYLYASKSIKRFIKADELKLQAVTPELLSNYEKWMLKIGKSPTTVSMYLRAVRFIFIQEQITGENYPFSKGKYQIPESNNFKKALTLDEISKIFNYKPKPGSATEKYRDFWLLSYLCNGANINDLLHLKYKNIDGEAITFIRGKTAHKKKGKLIVAIITPEMRAILDKYKQPYESPDTYLFPILSNDQTHQERLTKVKSWVRLINRHIKKVGKAIGIETNLTTYTARHSFATVLKRSGASIEFISESLGHSNIKTTENYLADFELDKKREMAKLLTKWNKKDQ